MAKFTEDHKTKISEKLKGKPLTEEHKRKLSDAKKGKISNCAKDVTIIYKGKKYTFQSMTEAEEYFKENLDLKIFYWLRRDIPKKHIEDIDLIQIGNFIKYASEKIMH